MRHSISRLSSLVRGMVIQSSLRPKTILIITRITNIAKNSPSPSGGGLVVGDSVWKGVSEAKKVGARFFILSDYFFGLSM